MALGGRPDVSAKIGTMEKSEPALKPKATRPEPVWLLWLARASVLWERLWRGLWPASGVVGLFLALALFDVLPGLPAWLHVVILAGAIGGSFWLLLQGFREFGLPGTVAGRRRLERDSGLTHRPLELLADRMASGAIEDPVSRKLWQAAQRRARAEAAGLRLDWPHPDLGSRDPWALRTIVVMALLLGAVSAGPEWPSRLAAAFAPQTGGAGPGASAALDLWITPPEYTRTAPIFLTGQGRMPGAAAAAAPPAGTAEKAEAEKLPRTILVPEGSHVTARLTAGAGVPVLSVNGTEQKFTEAGTGAYQIDAVVTTGTRVAVRHRGRELGGWTIRVVPDGQPGIAFKAPPSVTERQTVRLDYTAADDYGVEKITAIVTLKAEVAGHIDRTPLRLPLSVPGRSPKQLSSVAFQDLTPSPWAGQPVTVQLEATDGAGHTGLSEAAGLILPEREFHHPVARALIATRKDLLKRGDEARPMAQRTLQNLSVRPEAFGGGIVPFLGMRTALGRLVLDHTPQALADVEATLWDVALEIEDGGLSVAERDLRDAQQRLAEALDQNADAATIQQLMSELKQAMDNYLNALEQRMQELAQGEPQTPADSRAQQIDREQLQQMLDKMQQMAESGSRDAAKEMLQQLREMMENLQTQPQQQAASPEEAEQMRQQMKEMEDLAKQQRELMDETFRQSQSGKKDDNQGQNQQNSGQQSGQQMPGRQGRQPQSGQQGQNPGGDGSAQGGGDPAQRQEALRRQLGELMRQMGERGGGDIPKPFGRAERSMRESTEALQRGEGGAAVKPQGDAVDQLQRGIEDMAQQMSQQMQSAAQREGNNQGRQQGKDPLGRPLPGNGLGSSQDVRIPEEAELQRAREIQDELRRRSGDPARPKIERDYIDRLLKQF